MAYALNIRSDDLTAERITDLWTHCESLESRPSMVNLGYQPHITFAIYESVELNRLLDVFDSVFQQTRRSVIKFDKICMFESKDSLILWANPTLPSELISVHEKIHKMVDTNLCHEHYRPNSWVPHCSLATSVSLSKKAQALDLIHQKFPAFDVVFDVADCVSFLPVDIVREKKLVKLE